MRDSQGGGESDPAEGVRRRCLKNSPSVLSCIGKRTKEGCDRGSEVGTVPIKDSRPPVVVGGPCDAMRSGIGITITLPGHPISMTQHYFNHE